MLLLRFFKKFYNLYLAVVLLLLVFAAPFIGYPFKRNYAIGNMIHIVIAIAIVLLLLLLVKNIKNKHPKIMDFINSDYGFRAIIFIGTAILLWLEVFVVSGGWFIAGWDTRNVIFPNMQIDSDYMSMYPNQIFLAGLFRAIYMFMMNFELTDFYDYYFMLVLISTALTCAVVVFVAFISKKITNNLCAVATFILAAVFLGLSPWIMIPYSDNFAMFCTVFVLFSYTNIKPRPIKWGLIFLFSIIGMAIKPTAIFVLIAIIVVEVVLIITKHKKIQNVISTTAGVLIAIVLSATVINCVSSYGVKINEENNFSATHFLMMGVNMENQGSWTIDDVNFSRSFNTVEAREDANINEWLWRLQTYGPVGIGKIFFYKTMTNFGDGAFAWEAERPWMMENKGFNPLVWGIYGIDPADNHNDNNNYFAYAWQVMWLMIILGNILLIVKNKNNKYEFMMCISMLAISAFLTLFEPDPRYIMLYVPYMVIMAPWGFYSIAKTARYKALSNVLRARLTRHESRSQ